MNHSWCKVRLSRAIMWLVPRSTALDDTRSDLHPWPRWASMMSWTKCLGVVQRVEDKLWKSGKARKPWDYQKVTQSLPPPPPCQQSCYELPVVPGGEHHESRFVVFPWKKIGCQELWSLWDGEPSKKSVLGELCGRRNSAFPASFGLSVLFWEFGPQSLTAVLFEGVSSVQEGRW